MARAHCQQIVVSKFIEQVQVRAAMLSLCALGARFHSFRPEGTSRSYPRNLDVEVSSLVLTFFRVPKVFLPLCTQMSKISNQCVDIVLERLKVERMLLDIFSSKNGSPIVSELPTLARSFQVAQQPLTYQHIRLLRRATLRDGACVTSWCCCATCTRCPRLRRTWATFSKWATSSPSRRAGCMKRWRSC